MRRLEHCKIPNGFVFATELTNVQRSAKRFLRGCEKFVPALAYLFCLALTGSCLARFAYFLPISVYQHEGT